jgi:precorrin-6B methylase 2
MNTNRQTKTTLGHGNDESLAGLGWQSAHGWPMPKRLELASPEWSVDRALRALSQGTGLLWQGDFVAGRTLLQNVKQRLTRKTRQSRAALEALPWPDRFHRIRLQRAQTARQLGGLLIEVAPDYGLEYRRAPDASLALQMAYGGRWRASRFVMPLTELMGVLSAYEWHRKGLPVTALGQSIYPRWGVFAPTRHEYLDLVMQAPLREHWHQGADVGTGTGVLAMLLATRGLNVVASDTNEAARDCALDNATRLGLSSQIQVVAEDLIPSGQFDLLVCNPPWLPGHASGPLEAAVYDPGHQMLKGFLKAATGHLKPGGQAWLILSDLAEHLQLRSRQQLLQWIDEAGLAVTDRLDAKPTHGKRLDRQDPLYDARQAEITSLWLLCSSDETP